MTMAGLGRNGKSSSESFGVHVLLVLKDSRLARAQGLALQLRGCQVSATSHVRRAVELAVDELPDLILTDAGDLMRQLLAADPRTRQIPVLAGV
jgi:DNA-binding response OmpR family regulator